MPKKESGNKEDDKLTRIAVVSHDRCKPKRCAQECKKTCPIVRSGALCIEVMPQDKIAKISEDLCIGCGLCVKKCPFGAVQIINLPRSLSKDTTHRYGPNSFKLHRLPLPRPGQVLGLVGTNGIGKSTALQILSQKLKPNLGNFKNPPEWKEILNYFRGSELQGFFQRQLEEKCRSVTKPQYVDLIARQFKDKPLTCGEFIRKKQECTDEQLEFFKDQLDMHVIWDRPIYVCSGGELQRFAIMAAVVQKADVFMFDEPSSYLDVRQRLKAGRAIRSLLDSNIYVIVVEHDLAVLDYLSDFICCLYGQPGAYGVVTHPFSCLDGINHYLEGFIPTENLRFREPINFKIAEVDDAEIAKQRFNHEYPAMKKTQGGFTLDVEPGCFSDSEIVVLLGENGTGKTTLIKMLAGIDKPDGDTKLPELGISYKPQTITPKFSGSVKDLLQTKIQASYLHPQFQTDVFKPLRMDELLDRQVQELSGGELQRVAITLALGKPANLYLIDEPSAFLDCEQRLVAAKVIKRFVLHSKVTAFVVEHDFIMATYLASKVIVYSGTPGVKATASPPQPLLHGMNDFLKSLDITLRRDPTNLRPRINKYESVKDREQKSAGQYFMQEQAAMEIALKKEAKRRADKEKKAAGGAPPKKKDDLAPIGAEDSEEDDAP
eukprot:NODE_440_length_2082_cov_60.467782_g352_i0.p1 GENE.NODE_440_length_2082_cov_60.467782_g352_i0~~NODE_440_length_2082_cov_60.467782_g352_i0.p1  ORF type:complete len:660 (-),score=250.74 NODE_440_length_2082_cov_60.467782_g352_i0:60-2039(-)